MLNKIFQSNLLFFISQNISILQLRIFFWRKFTHRVRLTDIIFFSLDMKELKTRPCPVVFASFSGGPKACMYKVLQVTSLSLSLSLSFPSSPFDSPFYMSVCASVKLTFFYFPSEFSTPEIRNLNAYINMNNFSLFVSDNRGKV